MIPRPELRGSLERPGGGAGPLPRHPTGRYLQPLPSQPWVGEGQDP